MSEFKPCPFCGGEATLIHDGGMYCVICDANDCIGYVETEYFYTSAEAIAAWNTRATTTIGKVQVEIEPVLHGTLTWRELERADMDTAAAHAAEMEYRAERTCHDVNTRFNAWTCSECKCTQLLMFDDYGEPTLNVDGVASVPNYCPNCGARVIK